MLKRILAAWLVANFLIVGTISWLTGGWYLGWQYSPAVIMLAELGLIMMPNLLIPVLILRSWWPESVGDLREALGWQWNGGRAVIFGIAAFLVALLLMAIINRLVGESIPYNLPGAGGGITAKKLLDVAGLLLGLLAFMAITVLGEETIFRGWIQTQVGYRHGVWAGLMLAAVLFGLRHLPADIYFAYIWHATPRIWLSRQLQLYAVAFCLGLARHFGGSTYASAIMHVLILAVALFRF